MQLRLQLTGAPAASVRITRVLATGDGAQLGHLTANQPTTWLGSAGQYTPWDGSLSVDVPALVSYKLSTASLPAGTSLRASSYELSVTVEGVLADGTVLRAADSFLFAIAAEPHLPT